MKNILKNSLILSFLLLAASTLFGQTILVHTTLSAAVTTSSATTIPLTSVTGVTAGQSVLFVADGLGEGMFVNSVNTTANTVTVTRGYQSLGKARAHLSGALVFITPANAGYPSAINTVAPSGSCTRSSIPYLPVISLGVSGAPTLISDCVGGVWVAGSIVSQNNTQFRILAPNSGGTAYTSLGGSGTTLVAGTLYCTEVDLPFNKLLTGIGILNGTTVGTDNHLVALLDSQGNVIANSALAGALSATASVYQNYAFTTSYYAVGPAQYFACAQSNGTTATLRTIQTGTQDTYLTTSKTGSFGTIPTITVPTSFTTAVGVYSYIY